MANAGGSYKKRPDESCRANSTRSRMAGLATARSSHCHAGSVDGTSTAQPRFRTVLLGSFAGVALLLSAVGIYGVMAYAVSRRTREIGIRMALGSHSGDMLKLIFGQSMTLTLLGILLGLAGAFAVTRVMNSLLYGVTSTDPFTFTGVTLLLCVVIACKYIPARRAMRVSPMVALRDE